MKDMNPSIIALIVLGFLACIGLGIATYKLTHLPKIDTNMKIRYITPFSTDSCKRKYPNIGGEYNKVISELPEDCWIVLRDGDTMFLTPDWGQQIKSIIEANPDYDLIGCMTNRLSVKEQLSSGILVGEDMPISNLIRHSNDLWFNEGVKVKSANLVAGLCMIFPKSVWEKVGGFPENDITFDRVFCSKVLKSGGKIGIAKGLYIFHLYRWGSEKPQNSINHLINK